MKNKETLVKEKFMKFSDQIRKGYTDWSIAADVFILWTITNDFQLESFKNFVEWIDDEYLSDDIVWSFFFEYCDNFEKFANDWIVENERKNYIDYAHEYCQS